MFYSDPWTLSMVFGGGIQFWPIRGEGWCAGGLLLSLEKALEKQLLSAFDV